MNIIAEINNLDWSESFIEECNLAFNKPSPMQSKPETYLKVYCSYDMTTYVFNLKNVTEMSFISPANAFSNMEISYNEKSKLYTLNIYDYSSKDETPNLTIMCDGVEFLRV